MACPVPPGGHAQHLYERNVRPGYRKARGCRTHITAARGRIPSPRSPLGQIFFGVRTCFLSQLTHNNSSVPKEKGLLCPP